MASSVSKSKDNFLRNIIIGFFAIIAVLVTVLIIVDVDYDDFDHLTSFQEIRTQEEDQYLVYYYSPSCGFCADIKNNVLSFARSNKADMKVYIINAYDVTGVNNVVDPNNPTEAMDGTPSLVTVVNGQIVDLNSGAEDIPNVFDEINAGTYSYID